MIRELKIERERESFTIKKLVGATLNSSSAETRCEVCPCTIELMTGSNDTITRQPLIKQRLGCVHPLIARESRVPP